MGWPGAAKGYQRQSRHRSANQTGGLWNGGRIKGVDPRHRELQAVVRQGPHLAIQRDASHETSAPDSEAIQNPVVILLSVTVAPLSDEWDVVVVAVQIGHPHWERCLPRSTLHG